MASLDFNSCDPELGVGPKWDWVPLSFGLSFRPFLFSGWISLRPRYNVVWHWGLGHPGNQPHVWIDRRTVREFTRDVNNLL